MKTTKKEIADFIGIAETCTESTRIFGGKDRLLLQIRSWSVIKSLHPNDADAIEFQDALQAFICEAINEKIERIQKGGSNEQSK